MKSGVFPLKRKHWTWGENQRLTNITRKNLSPGPSVRSLGPRRHSRRERQQGWPRSSQDRPVFIYISHLRLAQEVGIQRISEVLLTLGINKFLQIYHLQMIIRISVLPVSYIAVIIIILMAMIIILMHKFLMLNQGLGDFWQTALLDQKANVPSLGPPHALQHLIATSASQIAAHSRFSQTHI